MTQWTGHAELSLEKEKSKRVMIYYAYPVGEKYGYFTSTSKDAQERFLRDMNERSAE